MKKKRQIYFRLHSAEVLQSQAISVVLLDCHPTNPPQTKDPARKEGSMKTNNILFQMFQVVIFQGDYIACILSSKLLIGCWTKKKKFRQGNNEDKESMAKYQLCTLTTDFSKIVIDFQDNSTHLQGK